MRFDTHNHIYISSINKLMKHIKRPAIGSRENQQLNKLILLFHNVLVSVSVTTQFLLDEIGSCKRQSKY